ncbi:MAG: IS1595 family transposase [Xanthomonadales bacterium]|nr:IS1595 family transposase [Xanthomonadales bacterium]
MPLNYRLKSERRNLTLDQIYKMSEVEASAFIAEARWGSTTKQVCSNCGSVDAHYHRKSRKQWLCKHCGHTFSLTSNTVFANLKISHKQLLKFCFMFCNSAKGNSAVELTGMFGVSHKTAWIINQKIREGLLWSRDESKLSGMVHIDGGYFGGKRRHGRLKKYNIPHKNIEAKIASKGKSKTTLTPAQKRNYWLRKNKRRLLINIREVDTNGNNGGIKTRVAVCKTENEVDINKLCKRFVVEGSTIWTDDHNAYNSLNEKFKHESVEHSIEFMSVDGVHNNQAESYFSRLRRSEYGVYHGMRAQYLLDYAQEAAWREDMRKVSLKDQVISLISKVMSTGDSSWWKGYHQGYRRKDELMNF